MASWQRSVLARDDRRSIVWTCRLPERPGAPALQARVAAKSVNHVAVAMANRLDRIAWSMVRRNQPYQRGLTITTTA